MGKINDSYIDMLNSELEELLKIFGDVENKDKSNDKKDLKSYPSNYEVSNENDLVSHPSHYQAETGMEVIDVVESFTFDLQGIEATDTGNILKYICRWKKKNGLQDLKKAKWYIDHLINHVEKLEENNK